MVLFVITVTIVVLLNVPLSHVMVLDHRVGRALLHFYTSLSLPFLQFNKMAEMENGQSISAGMIPSHNSKLLLTGTDEIALYDRQIRLWGVQAQEK